MLLNETDLRRIDAAVFLLTGFRMTRGMTGWEAPIAEALELGLAAKESLRMIEGLILKTEVKSEIQCQPPSGDGEVPADQGRSRDT